MRRGGRRSAGEGGGVAESELTVEDNDEPVGGHGRRFRPTWMLTGASPPSMRRLPARN